MQIKGVLSGMLLLCKDQLTRQLYCFFSAYLGLVERLIIGGASSAMGGGIGLPWRDTEDAAAENNRESEKYGGGEAKE